MIRQLLRQTQDRYRITSRALAKKSEITPQHLSEFRNGNSELSTKVLWQMLQAMDELAPGSRRYFCSLLAGGSIAGELGSFGVIDLMAVMEPDEVAELLNANIELVSKAILYLSNADRADIMSAIAQSLRSEVKQKAQFTKEEVKAS